MGDIAVKAEHSHSQNIWELTLFAAAIGRETSVRLLVPNGWEPGAARRWPTLFLLHGGDDDPTCWTRKTDILQRAVDSGVLVVCPSGGKAGFYTDWRAPDSHGTTPAWGRYTGHDLPALIEARYGGGHRIGVAGVSMGGYGAVTLAARHPGRFAVAASYSGMVRTTGRGTSLLLGHFLRSVGERVDAMWGRPRLAHRARWRAADPMTMAAALIDTPVYLAVGDGTRVPGDPPAPGDRLLERIVAPMTRAFADRLETHGVTFHLSVGPGTHDWPSWQRELTRSWPFLTEALTIR